VTTDAPAREPVPPLDALRAFLGAADIYLIDQILRGRIARGMTVLDAGCGYGRNLALLLQAGLDVRAVDADPDAIASVRALAAHLAPHLPPSHFRAEPVEATSFADATADVVVSSAVLHFARDAAHFAAMLRGCWRVLRPGGLLFCRLASRDGVADAVHPLGDGRYLLPDGSERFLVDEPMLRAATAELGGELADPLKTTIVHGQRAMCTWVVRRAPGRSVA
jgi:SAM-dependent methyltransferase